MASARRLTKMLTIRGPLLPDASHGRAWFQRSQGGRAQAILC